MDSKLRLDKYLWAVRIFKTRTQAAEAIDKGNVKMGDVTLKPSKQVSIGDTYSIKTEARKYIIQVTGLLYERKQYSEVVNYYADITPQEQTVKMQSKVFVDYTGKRPSKQGRPTKKNRRDMNTFFD